jgi:polar amino acid transport system substrate-binding protein
MKHRLPSALAALALLTGALLPVSAQAEGPSCSRTYTLALHEHGLLYNDSTHTGIDKDVADELIRRSGCHIVVSLMPRSRIWKLLENGTLDFSLSGITDAQREQYASFAWYFADKFTLIVRKDSNVHSVADFVNAPALRLGQIPSFRYSAAINRVVDRLNAQNRVLDTRTYDALYKNLILGRIQGLIIEPFDFSDLDQYEVRHLVRIVETDDVPTPHGLIMSKKTISPEEVEKWRALIAEMHADGTLLHIFRKYFSREQAEALLNF